jgi:transcriptional regulator with XRE-family HTH domain
MEYEHFGILLQELRLKYNLSREKLAQGICTPKQIYRIEKGYSDNMTDIELKLNATIKGREVK